MIIFAWQVDQSLQMQHAMAKVQNQVMSMFMLQPVVLPPDMQFLVLTVRRDHIVQDTMAQVWKKKKWFHTFGTVKNVELNLADPVSDG